MYGLTAFEQNTPIIKLSDDSKYNVLHAQIKFLLSKDENYNNILDNAYSAIAHYFYENGIVDLNVSSEFKASKEGLDYEILSFNFNSNGTNTITNKNFISLDKDNNQKYTKFQSLFSDKKGVIKLFEDIYNLISPYDKTGFDSAFIAANLLLIYEFSSFSNQKNITIFIDNLIRENKSIPVKYELNINQKEIPKPTFNSKKMI